MAISQIRREIISDAHVRAFDPAAITTRAQHREARDGRRQDCDRPPGERPILPPNALLRESADRREAAPNAMPRPNDHQHTTMAATRRGGHRLTPAI
jgi:hypothetical protein